jgi:hypothetical protein
LSAVGVAALRRYHQVPNWRLIWMRVDVPGMPERMVTTD